MRQQPGQSRIAPPLGIGQDHAPHIVDALLVEEHVLGPAEPDALGPEVARMARIRGRLGVGTHLHAAEPVRPAHQRREITGELRLDRGHPPLHDLPRRPIDGDDLTLLQRLPGGRHDLPRIVDTQAACPRNARPPHPARYHSSVARHAATSGQDAARGMHAMDVFRAGLDAHEDDVTPIARQAFGLARIKDDLTGGRPRRGRQARGQNLAGRLGIKRRMQQLVQRRRIDPLDRLRARQHIFRGQIDRDLDGSLRRTLAISRLQDPEPALLDRKLDVLHVPIVRLEPTHMILELLEDRRHLLLERRVLRPAHRALALRQRLRRAQSRHDVLALRIQKVLAIE